MSTAYVCRLIIVAPTVTKAANVATWMNNNLAAATVPANLGPGLSPTGIAPATYQWCSVALTAPDAKACLTQLCTLAVVAVPTNAQWDNATPAQRKAWWVGVRASVFANYGVWCQLADNDGTWDDPVAALALRGLSPV